MKTTVSKKLIGFVIILLVCNNLLNAQDTYNKWVFGVGFNVVDIRNGNSINGLIEDYLNTDINDLNFNSIPVRFVVSRYVYKGFSIQASTSFNNIKRGYTYKEDKLLVDYSFFAVDAKVKYDINYIIGKTGKFKPYVVLGIAYSEIGDLTTNNYKCAGYGLNYWFSDTIGINFQSDYNHSSDATETDYFQHSLGLVFKLSNMSGFKWRGKDKNCNN